MARVFGSSVSVVVIGLPVGSFGDLGEERRGGRGGGRAALRASRRRSEMARAFASASAAFAWNPWGWSRISELAQQFEWKSLLESQSWPKVWANPVSFTLLASASASAARGVASHAPMSPMSSAGVVAGCARRPRGERRRLGLEEAQPLGKFTRPR